MIKGAQTNMDHPSKEGCNELDIVTLENQVIDLKKQLDAANANVKVLTDKAAESTELMKKATDALNEYMAAEKKALLDSITAKSEFKLDELKDKTVADLRIVNLAIDKAKPAPTGTVKSVRGAGDSATPTRPNVMADGRINPRISIIGHPILQADGSIKWEN